MFRAGLSILLTEGFIVDLADAGGTIVRRDAGFSRWACRSAEWLRLAFRGEIPMRPTQQKITLSASRERPFDKPMLSRSNVRHVKAGVSIEELAENIARRTLLCAFTVPPVR